MPSIDANVLGAIYKVNHNVSVHVRYHLYRQEHVVNRRSKENGVLSPSNYQWFEPHRGTLSTPDCTVGADTLARHLAHGDPYDDKGASLRNLLLQLHSLKRVTSEFASGDFDVAVFARPDLQYHDALPGRAIEFAARHDNACILPSWQWWGGFNDRFAICGRAAALAYGNRLDEIDDFYAATAQPLKAEKFLEYVVRRNSLKLRTMRTQASRIRIGGVAKLEDFGMFSSASGGMLRRFWLAYLGGLSALM